MDDPIIRCEVCNAVTDEYIADRQGGGISTELTEQGAAGFYGSYLYDGDRYYWTNPKIRDRIIANRTAVLTCDDCVRQMIDKGYLVLSQSNCY